MCVGTFCRLVHFSHFAFLTKIVSGILQQKLLNMVQGAKSNYYGCDTTIRTVITTGISLSSHFSETIQFYKLPFLDVILIMNA